MATPHIGPATDLYPLGCLLFTLLEGDEPFVGSNEELMEQHKHAPPPALTLRSHIPSEVEGFVQRLHAATPALVQRAIASTHYDFADRAAALAVEALDDWSESWVR